MINSNYFDWIYEHGNPGWERLMFGVVPAYPIFMFAGIMLVIIASIVKLKLKGIPLREFELAILIVVPIGILGASIFGKIFLPNVVWYHVFFFWEPGMSLFGSLALGSTAGFVWFYRRSKKTLISVWVYADCIVPNILLGQFLGRWGNFYNHEILGQVVSYDSLTWLPGFIKDRLFYFPNLAGFELPNDWWQEIQEKGMSAGVLETLSKWGDFKGLSLKDVLTANPEIGNSSTWLRNSDGLWLDPTIYNYGTLLFRAPLFLIEGIGNLVLWLFISFVVTNLGRWFSHPKPWDLQPKAYPGWYNKKYKTLNEKDVLALPTQIPVKYKKVKVKTKTGESRELKLGFYQVWNKAYYWYVPEESKVHEFELAQIQREKLVNENLAKLKKVKRDYHYQKNKIKTQYQNQVQRVAKNSVESKKLKAQLSQNLGLNKKNYLTRREEIYGLIGNWTRIFVGNPDGKNLEKLNNPHQFFVIRSGVITGCYLIGYLILRIILETQRLDTELMIPKAPIADYLILSLILLAGIFTVILAQFISPYRYREVDWLYEKSY